MSKFDEMVRLIQAKIEAESEARIKEAREKANIESSLLALRWLWSDKQPFAYAKKTSNGWKHWRKDGPKPMGMKDLFKW